jgi:hypothetical protein
MSRAPARIGMAPPCLGAFIREEILDELGLSVSEAAIASAKKEGFRLSLLQVLTADDDSGFEEDFDGEDYDEFGDSEPSLVCGAQLLFNQGGRSGCKFAGNAASAN